MIPLLTLGIPGSTIAAVLIGMFLVNGLQPGPSIFAEEPPLFMGGQLISPREFIFGIFAAGLIGIACGSDWAASANVRGAGGPNEGNVR